MSDKNDTLEKRRKLLKSVAAGGGAIIAGKTLPEKWGRPVVDSVMLPAHAATSHVFGGVGHASIDTDSMFAQVLDSLVTPSHASGTDFTFSWCITPNNESTADVFILLVEQNLSFAILYTANNVPIGSTPTVLIEDDGCSNYVNAGEWMNKIGLIRDAKASDGSATITIENLNPGSNFRFIDTDLGINEVRMLELGPCGPMSVPNCKSGRRR